MEWDTVSNIRDKLAFPSTITFSGFVSSISAISLFASFETRRFARDAEEGRQARDDARRCMACDLLILDDLGSEMTTAFIQSVLYQIVNTRLLTGGRTIISTNLRPQEIGERYSPAILSRIQGEYQIKAFFGRDIRSRSDR